MRIPFPKPLILDAVHGPYSAKPFSLVAEFEYVRPSGEIVRVPMGYRTDFASVPVFFHRIFPPVGHYSWAAVIHDWLCDSKTCSHKEAAKVFSEAMEDCGVGRIKRSIMTAAVLLFGPKFKGVG